MVEEKGKQTFNARARLMILLGEQLITDEVVAVSELIKNSYDADSTNMEIHLDNVSKKTGEITIIDNGHGMTRKKLLTSWLEIGTISKLKKKDESVKRSESGERSVLGNKGLGRLAVHKIGKTTEITTRRTNSEKETKLVLDWVEFEDEKKFLSDIENEWEERNPISFSKNSDQGFERGTKIQITNLQRIWTSDMIKRVKEFIWTIQSPIVALKNFKIELFVNDPNDIQLKFKTMSELLDSSHYTFRADVDKNGFANITYRFKSPLYENLERKHTKKNHDLKQEKMLQSTKETSCGLFTFKLYCWELDHRHKKQSFGSLSVYTEMIKPQTGVRVFRDGFRVFPYGGSEDDWLHMDKKRIEQFQLNVGKNQIIGAVEISSKNNPNLIDKSDREGLINNLEYVKFKNLIQSAIAYFQGQREQDRSKMKDAQKKNPRINKFSKNLETLSILLKKENIAPKTQIEITSLIDGSARIFEETLNEYEEPLLGAASIGLTYLIPTHELRRSVKESTKILKKLIKDGSNCIESAQKVIQHMNEIEQIVRGITRLSQKIDVDKKFKLKIPVEQSISLMKKKLERNNIRLSIEYRKDIEVSSQPRSIILMLLNMIDNSVYWLLNKQKDSREIKLIVDELEKSYVILISDNGPGIDNPLELLIQPFFTTKIDGMGLGLFICNRTANSMGLKLELFEKNDIPGLLSGANIGILFPKRLDE